MADFFVFMVGADSQCVEYGLDVVRHIPVLYFSEGFMEEAYEGGLDMIFNYGLGRRPEGLG